MKFIASILLLISVTTNAQLYTINPCTTFGARGNGVADDTQALQDAINYNQVTGFPIILPNGTFRIKKNAISGGKFIDYSDVRVIDIFKSTSFNLVYYTKARMSYPFILKGSGRTIIICDFADSTEQAAFWIAAKGDKRNVLSSEQYNGEISNLGIYYKGYCDSLTGQPNNVTSKVPVNKIIGIVNLLNQDFKISDVTFHGLNIGLISNNAYYNSYDHLKFQYCDRPIITVHSNYCTYTNTTQYFCNKPSIIASEGTKVINFVAEHCKSALQIAAGDCSVDNSYFESIYKEAPQLIIGESDGDMYYHPLNRTDGIMLTNCRMTALPGIDLRKTARKITFIGGYVKTGVTYVDTLTSVALIGTESSTYYFPKQITKILF